MSSIMLLDINISDLQIILGQKSDDCVFYDTSLEKVNIHITYATSKRNL